MKLGLPLGSHQTQHAGGVWASRGCAGDQDEKRGDCRERQVRDGREGGWWER